MKTSLAKSREYLVSLRMEYEDVRHTCGSNDVLGIKSDHSPGVIISNEIIPLPKSTFSTKNNFAIQYIIILLKIAAYVNQLV